MAEDVTLVCPECEWDHDVEDPTAGHLFFCPECGARVTVEAEWGDIDPEDRKSGSV